MSANYTPGNIASYNPTGVASYNEGTAQYNAGGNFVAGFTTSAVYNSPSVVEVYNPPSTVSGYNTGTALYNSPTGGVNWNSSGTYALYLIEGGSMIDSGPLPPASGSSPTCPAPTFFQGPLPGTPEVLEVTYTEYVCTPAPAGPPTETGGYTGNFATFNPPSSSAGFTVVPGNFTGSFEANANYNPPTSSNISGYIGNTANYNAGSAASYNAPTISGYNPPSTPGNAIYVPGNIATYNSGTEVYNPGNLIPAGGNTQNYNPGNPANYNTPSITSYFGNNAIIGGSTVAGYTGNNVATYSGIGVNYNTGSAAAYNPPSISGYNNPIGVSTPNYNVGSPATYSPTNVAGYNTGVAATYNTGNVGGYNVGTATYNAGGAVYNEGTPASYTGNFTATFNASGNANYNTGSPASFTSNFVAGYNAGNISAYNPTSISGYNTASTAFYNSGSAVYNAGSPASTSGGNAATYNTGAAATYNPPTITGYNAPSVGGGCCFAGDTLITMADLSTKPIETIEVGDEILSYNPDTQELETNEVSEIITRVNRVMFEYILQNGITIKASDDHPFFVVGKGYASMNPGLTMQGYRSLTSVAQVQAGDSFVDKDGNAIRINQIVSIEYPYTVYTFNNKKKSSPNFFANGVLTY